MAKKKSPRKKKKVPPPPSSKGPPALDERIQLRMSTKDKRAFKRAARNQGITLSLWLRLAAWKVINDHEGQVELLSLD